MRIRRGAARCVQRSHGARLHGGKRLRGGGVRQALLLLLLLLLHSDVRSGSCAVAAGAYAGSGGTICECRRRRLRRRHVPAQDVTIIHRWKNATHCSLDGLPAAAAPLDSAKPSLQRQRVSVAAQRHATALNYTCRRCLRWQTSHTTRTLPRIEALLRCCPLNTVSRGFTEALAVTGARTR
jgi:hypothetical protein